MVIAINGSPRKNWNTHTLLTNALEGAKSKEHETELINLYDLNYKGCIACLTCKKKGSIAKCAMKDDLQSVLEKIEQCDALILGSPIYLGEVTGAMRSFMERLIFQYISYDTDRTPLFSRQIQTAFIYTMNVPEEVLEKIGYTERFKTNARMIETFIGPTRMLVSTETNQIDDYSKYNMTMFNPIERKQRYEEVFPKECQKAFDMGASMV